jgi:hypothetical protein
MEIPRYPFSIADVSALSYCYTVPKKKAKLPLSKTHPKLAKEADGWDPNTHNYLDKTELDWKCTKGHRWKKRISLRTRSNPKFEGTGCPTCNNLILVTGVNDLKTMNPELAREAHGWNPSEIKFTSSAKLDWKCKKGHIWPAAVRSRSGKIKSGCPYCWGRKPIIGETDIATTHPELAKEAFGWDPTSVSYGSEKILEWKCKHNHIYKAKPNSRTGTNKTNCPVCSNQKVLFGFNDLETLFPLIASEADGWDPKLFIAKAHFKKSWKCQLGHLYEAAIGSRTGTHPTGCPYCRNKKLLKGFNDLATTHPELAKEAFGWEPTSIIAGNNKSFDWKCSIGHIYPAKASSRSSKNQTGCPVCANQKILKGFNDLATTHPELAKEAFGWDPTSVSYGSEKVLKWKCPINHTYKTTPNSRSTKGYETGCPTCAESGYDPNADGFLYFIQHSEWKMYQIGITNNPKNRLVVHSRLGWELIEIRGPMDGHLTQQWETAILRMLKAKGADLANSKIAGKFDGYSEAWSKSTFPVKSIRELMRLTEEFEEGKAIN